MDQIAVLVALCLPTALGGLWLNLFVPLSIPGREGLVWGYGTLIGLLVVPLLMRMINALGLPISFPIVATVATFLMASALIKNVRVRRFAAGGEVAIAARDHSPLSPESKALILLLILLITGRLLTLGLEVLWRPIFPWDATMHWATKARVWFEFSSMVPFVDDASWLNNPDGGVFNDAHPHYPATIPLLQVWMASAIGSWNESLINIPWLLCLSALAAAFYGQLRLNGASVTIATIGVYLLVSMPLINTHVALAGYADLFLGACYCAAIMSLQSWTISRQPWRVGLALFFAACCPLIKNEGLFWMLTFVPALVVILAKQGRAVLLLTGILIAAVAVLIITPGDFEIAGRSLVQLKVHYRERALEPILISLWLQGNWHLASYLILAVLALGCLTWRTSMTAVAGIATALACALLMFLFLFTYTKFASGAVRFTAIGRISIHLLPAFLYLTTILCVGYFRRAEMAKASMVSPERPG